MEEIFEKISTNGFSDVAGLAADIALPMSQSLVNEIIVIALREDRTITSCQVFIHEQNRVSVRLKTNIWPWPLNLKLRLDASVDFTSFSSPKVRMWLENKRVLGSLTSFFDALPKWARLYGNQVVIDLDYFLHTPAQKRLFELIKSVDIKTETGRALFDVKIRVNE